ncbi:sulfatase/phosphatase domain-containing protein [Phnomibacter sp. MR]|uniref:sulfatase/phosphatase domain-containing protein n=1 Tax=Phnomibacter sp. MR TaxID=3042318 RepID=UPI003A8002E6
MAKNNDAPAWRTSLYYHYYEYPEPHRVAPHIGIRTAQYKLICFCRSFEQWELYDLRSDPSEKNNIAGVKAMTPIKKFLQQMLMKQALYYDDQQAVQLLQKAMVTTK